MKMTIMMTMMREKGLKYTDTMLRKQNEKYKFLEYLIQVDASTYM